MKLINETDKYMIYVIKQLVGESNLTTNVYLIQDKYNKKVLLIDPAYDLSNIVEGIDSINGKLVGIVITHSHADHVGALYDLLEVYKEVICYIHEDDYNGLFDGKVNEEKTVGIKIKCLNQEMIKRICKVKEGKLKTFGIELYILHTPGHTKGGICIELCGTNLLFTGDTAFENTYGRTDLATGNRYSMRDSLDKIFAKYPEFTIYPGHGEPAEIGTAKRKINLLFAYKGW